MVLFIYEPGPMLRQTFALKDNIGCRGLEEQAASLRNRVASLEQGVIVGWMLQNSGQ
jgi:hypothetical protein